MVAQVVGVVGGEDWSVVDEGSGGGENSGAAGEDGGLRLTSPPFASLGGLHSSEMSSSGLNDLRSVLDSLRGDTVTRVRWDWDKVGIFQSFAEIEQLNAMVEPVFVE